jgi:chromosome segregation ATPase
MISLEQIRLLEARIDKAVEMIKRLKAENSSLRSTLDSAQARMQDLETRIRDFKVDQEEIEQSILRAINSLDELEDEVSDAQEEKTSPASGKRRESTAAAGSSGKPRASQSDAPDQKADAEPPDDREPSDAEAREDEEDASGEEARELDIF